MHQLNVLIHVILQVETFATELAEQAVLAMDIHVSPKSASGQEGLATHFTTEDLSRLMGAVDMLLQAAYFCKGVATVITWVATAVVRVL
jgi:hypothetical protein